MKNIKIWYNNYYNLINYIKKYNSIPSINDKEYKSLMIWVKNQKNKYKNDKMTNEEIKNDWKFLMDKYLMNYEDKWYNILNKIIEYIEMNGINYINEIKDEYIIKWINNQETYYKKINSKLNKNEYMKKKWEYFKMKYLSTIENKWEITLKEVIDYYNINNKMPSLFDEEKKYRFLAFWISTQKYNYETNQEIMLNEKIKIEWEKHKILFN